MLDDRYPDDARSDAALDAYLGELAIEGISHDDFQEWLDESGFRYAWPPMSLGEAIGYYREDNPR